MLTMAGLASNARGGDSPQHQWVTKVPVPIPQAGGVTKADAKRMGSLDRPRDAGQIGGRDCQVGKGEGCRQGEGLHVGGMHFWH